MTGRLNIWAPWPHGFKPPGQLDLFPESVQQPKPYRRPLEHRSDAWLVKELARLERVWDEITADDEGCGGSPLEATDEAIQMVKSEQAHRKANPK